MYLYILYYYKENKIWQSLNDYREEMYGKIHSTENSMIDLVNNLTQTSVKDNDGSDFKSVEDYIAYRDSIIEKITSDTDVKDAIDKGLLSTETVTKQVDMYLSTLDQFETYYDEWYQKFGSDTVKGIKDIKSQFSKNVGADGLFSTPQLSKLLNGTDGQSPSPLVPEITQEQAEAMKAAQEFSEWIDNLSSKDQDLVYQISLDKDTAEWDLSEWQKHLEAARQSAIEAVETVATTEKISFSDLINDDEVKTKIADFETQLSTLSQALKDVRNGNLSNSKFVTLIKKFPELAAHTNDLESAIRNLIETEKTEVNTQFDKWKDKVTDEDISKVNTLNESLKATGDIIDKISTKSLKTVIDDLENVNSKISDIISDYNTNKYFTLENLEDLSNIAPEYLNFLVNENGQISLNTKAYKAYLTSKAKSLLVDNLETLYSTILGMSAEEAQAYKNKKAYDEETDSVKALLTATTQLYYTKAEAKDKENNTTAYTDAMKTAFSTASAYASIFESYINSLSSSQNELSSSTDSATSSLNSEKTALENAKDALEDQKTALENTKTGYENAKSSIESLIDWVEKYIKQTKNDEIDALEKKKSAIDDLIDSQKELLEAEKDEYDWNKTIKEKQNSVASDALAASIASLDDSSAGKKAQKEANDKLASSKSDMFDSLYDHEIDLRKDALDNLKDAQDDYYDKEIDKLNDYLDDETQIYKDACSMIDNDNGTLYNKLLTYCKKYTTTTEAEFNNMWTSAKTALTNYNTANLNTYDLINDLQQSIYNVDSAISAVEKSISSYSDAIDTIQTKIDKLSSSASTAASKISSLGSSSLGTNNYNLDASQFSSSSSSSSSSGSSNSDKSTSSGNTDSNNKTTKPVLANRWYVTLGKTRYESTMPSLGLAISDLIRKYIADVGYDNANISLINQKTVHHYATGTESAKGGLSLVGEKGAELRVLNPGDGILNNQIVRGLTALGTNPSQFIADAGKKLLSNIFGNNIKPNFSAITPNNSQEISIVNNIQGDVNQSTLKALVAAQKQIIQDSVKAVQSQSVKMRASNRV